MQFVETLRRYADGAKILNEWLGEGGHVVGQEHAQRRADVCLKCPNNQAGFSLADSVSRAIREQVEIKNHLRLRVDGEKKLLTCSVCLCVLKLKCWLPLDKVLYETEPDELEKFPAHCWVVKESSECK